MYVSLTGSIRLEGFEFQAYTNLGEFTFDDDIYIFIETIVKQYLISYNVDPGCVYIYEKDQKNDVQNYLVVNTETYELGKNHAFKTLFFLFWTSAKTFPIFCQIL